MNASTHIVSASVPVPVLLVDDEPADILALEAVLASPDLDLVVAPSGRDAVRLVEQCEFAVVVLDVRMPHMDGFETTSRIKKISRRGGPVPVIFVTGQDEEKSLVLRAYAEGGVDFIQKPFEPEILRAKVAVFAELHRAQRRLFTAQTQTATETARREATEDALSATEQRFQLLVESVKDYAIFLLDPKGHVASWNAGAKRFKGYEPNEILGKHFSVFYRQEDVDAGLCDRELEVAAREGRFEDEGWRVRKGGSLFWASVVITPLHSPQTGELVGFAKVTRDLTDRRRAEAERLRLAEEAARREAAESSRRDAEEQRERAERAVRAREDLLAIVSHDLRNPLGTVLLRAQQIELLADESVAGMRTKDAARNILTAVDRMSRLVSDLLDLAKLEAGQQLPLELRVVDVGELVRQTIDLLEPLVAARRLTLSTNVAAHTFAHCDRDRVQQVLSNLIGNAIKFTSEGGAIHLSAKRMAGNIIIAIRDTGMGIPEAQVAHIFKPYWQSDAQKQRGAGLGLSIAKAIVDAHGGRIWVDSATGQGSTFCFTLQAAEAVQETKDTI